MLAVLAEAEQAASQPPATEKFEPSVKPEPAKEEQGPQARVRVSKTN